MNIYIKRIIKILFIYFILTQSLFSNSIASNDITKKENKHILSLLTDEQKLMHSTFTKEEKEYIKNKKNLNISNLTTFPPFNFNENEIAKGYTVDYMRLMSKYIGLDINFVSHKSFKEHLKMLKNGTVDIIPHLAVTKEREQFAEYTNFNHIEYTTGVVIRKSEKVLSIDELEDKLLAVTNKSFLHTNLKNRFPNQKFYLTSSTSEALDIVSQGKAYAVVGSLPALQYFIQKKWLSNVKIVNIDSLKLSQKTKLPMGVKKGNSVLKSILEKTNRIIPHNEIINLRTKWMGTINDDKINLLTNEEKAYLNKKKVIKMCVLPDWLPFEQIDEKIKHKGIGADILKIIEKKIDTKFVLIPTTKWSQSLKNIATRKCDILPVAMDIPSRHKTMNFTKPYVSEPFVVATKADELFIKDESQLSNKKIGIVASYAFIEVMKAKNPDIIIVEVKNTKEGLEKVSSGELFAYLDTMPTVGYFIQKHGMVDLKIAGKLNYDITLSIASRNDEAILNTIMQKALNTISKDDIRKIVGKWIEIKVHQEFDYKKLLYLTIGFMIIVIFILYRSRMIKNTNKELENAHIELLQQQEMVNKYVLILTTNLDGKITSVNDAYCNCIGYSKDELVGSSFDIIRHSDMKKEFFEELWKTIITDTSWTGEIKNKNKEGKDLYFNLIIEPLYENSKKIGYRSIYEDITDKKRIEELSITDKLTGLNNRLKIDNLLSTNIVVHKRYNTPFSIILLDIDNFKVVNDTYGHDIGDYILKEIAELLRATVRTTDATGRWGGEEFIVICQNTLGENSFVVAEHIRKAIEGYTFNTVGKLTVSLGVTEFNSSDSIVSLFKRVDKYLYKAKAEGKNRTSNSLL